MAQSSRFQRTSWGQPGGGAVLTPQQGAGVLGQEEANPDPSQPLRERVRRRTEAREKETAQQKASCRKRVEREEVLL